MSRCAHLAATLMKSDDAAVLWLCASRSTAPVCRTSHALIPSVNGEPRGPLDAFCAKKSSKRREHSPYRSYSRSSSPPGPNKEYVLPEPASPCATTVALNPAAHQLYTSRPSTVWSEACMSESSASPLIAPPSEIRKRRTACCVGTLAGQRGSRTSMCVPALPTLTTGSSPCAAGRIRQKTVDSPTRASPPPMASSSSDRRSSSSGTAAITNAYEPLTPNCLSQIVHCLPLSTVGVAGLKCASADELDSRRRCNEVSTNRAKASLK
eukprot:1633104-Pleurochrysis_carterae.AAC.7